MSIRDDLHKWANREWDRGNPVSIQEIAEQAERLHQQRTNSQFDATEKAIEASLAALAERNRAVADRDAAVQQAQIWKQEARTQAATVAEIYQLCTGNTGEPGNWHGAEPVRKLVAERNALAEHAVWLENELEEPAHMQADAYRQAVDRIHPYVGAGRLPASLDASLCCLIHAFDERDALAAHVERLTSIAEKLATVAPEYLDHLAADASFVLRDAPTTSLAALKAQWQAEALEALVEMWEEGRTLDEDDEYGDGVAGVSVTIFTGWLRNRAEDLRRQAEGR